jgi:Ca2+-binding RTX toxin-like protein
MARRTRAIVAAAAAAVFMALGPVAAHAAVTVAFAGGELTVTSDGAGDRVDIDRDAAGVIRVDVGDDGSFEFSGSATVANTTRIIVNAGNGDDNITLNEALGALPASTLNGGDGNDALTGASGGDTVIGGVGDDVLVSRGQMDQVIGGDGADAITGGDANDTIQADAGDDTIIWNPGDDTDVTDGGAGFDVNRVNGGGGAEQFTLARSSGTVFRFDRVNPAPFSIDGQNFERMRLEAGGGDDTFTAANDLTGLLGALEVNMGAGGVQAFDGSDLPDLVTAGSGTEQINTQEGADVYTWATGDAVDAVNLGTGTDEVAVSGSPNADGFEATAIATTLRVTTAGGSTNVDVEGANRLTVDAGAGNDDFTATPNLTDLVAVDVTGGADEDSIFGAAGAETLRGGAGNDTITANGGDDLLFGDGGTDTLTGGAGRDSFFCGGLGDTLDATAEDLVAADCLPPAAGGPPPAPELPAGFRGFAAPIARGRTGDLVVTVRNTHTALVRVRLGGTESAPRGAARVFTYKAVTKTIQPGARARYTLRAPAKLRRALRRTLARRVRLVRRPRITAINVATGGRTTTRPRIVVRRRAR